jgi:hypothetical protein
MWFAFTLQTELIPTMFGDLNPPEYRQAVGTRCGDSTSLSVPMSDETDARVFNEQVVI